MKMASRLASGSRVAVVGAGVSGAAFASALLLNARARGYSLDVRLYDGASPSTLSPPVVLTPECRARLAALGCRVPLELRTLELSGIEVISRGAREVLAAPPGGLWIIDGNARGAGGMSLVRKVLANAATAQGAHIVERQVERVEHQESAPDAPAAVRASGPLVVRARGMGERHHAVAFAGGVRSGSLGEALFPGFRAAPSLPAVHARVHVAPRLTPLTLARLWLAPLPGLDGLFLLPASGSVYALGYGAQATPADLCQALMMAARDGYLEEGFEIASLAPTRLPFGPARTLVAPGQLVVGAASAGHPLQLGLSETLSSCSRAAVALLEMGLEPGPLKRRYVDEGLAEALESATDGARSLAWLRRAGARAPGAFRRACARTSPSARTGVLGLARLSASQLLGSARWAGMREVLTAWVRSSTEPFPVEIPSLEPDLYYVVDDDMDSREGLTQLLESMGAKVVAFADELALFCAVARRPPTAILLDVVLNWVDGLRLCEGLKRHPLTRSTRILVMSGLNRPHVRARALEAGAEAFLPKPLDLDQLVGIITCCGGGSSHLALPRERPTFDEAPLAAS